MIAVLFFACTLQAQNSVGKVIKKSIIKEITLSINNFTAFKKGNEFNQTLDLDTYGKYELLLIPNQIFSESYISRKVNKIAGNIPLTFQGILHNKPNTKVAITINEGFLSGFVDTGNELIYFEPYKNFSATAKKDELIIYNAKDVISQERTCIANHIAEQTKKTEANNNKLKNTQAACYTVEMVLVADYGMYQKYGSNTLNQITSILNNVQSNYDNEFNHPISFKIVDDYIATNSGMDLWRNTEYVLDLMDDFGNSNYTNIPHDLASLWVTRDIWAYNADGSRNNTVTGAAKRSGLCTSKFNLMEDRISNADILRTTLAHEIGHNFNATHDLVGSSIMSSPARNSNTWSNTSKNEINAFYPGATCLCASGDAADIIFKSCGSTTINSNTLSISNVVVQNVGTISTGINVRTGWFLSTDNNININDYLIATQTVTSYNPNDYSIHNWNIDLNSIGVPPGSYYLGVITDYDNAVAEFNEANNISCISSSANITIKGSLPDLKITSCGIQTYSSTNVNYDNMVVQNFGTTSSKAATLGVYLSSNSIIKTTDYMVASAIIPALQEGATSTAINLKFNTKTVKLPAGNYYVGFIIDVDNHVTESNENNNLSCNSPFASIIITSSPASSCEQRDRAALTTLYNSTDGPNWRNKWNLNLPMDQWHGVYFNEDGCVTRLNLHYNNLKGNIPSEIGELSELTNLFFTGNQLSGQIPAELGKLTKLRILDLSSNQLTGNAYNIFRDLENLERLNLHGNQLSGEMPVELSFLEKLNSVILSNNNFSGCFDSRLRNLCYQIPLYSILINSNNNFNTKWVDFCIGNVSGNCNARLASENNTEIKNYPNPFENETTISYTLNKEKEVSVIIYDALGEQVEVLINNESQGKGKQTIIFNGSNYAAGIYYYSIQRGDNFDFKKMVLVK